MAKLNNFLYSETYGEFGQTMSDVQLLFQDLQIL